MPETRGGLQPASIYEVKNGSGGGLKVECMFNPFEYTVSKSNTYKEDAKNQGDTPTFTFEKAGAQTLKLNLFFDTYEKGEDVSKITDKLWKFMETKTRQENNETKKVPPPEVAFHWASFHFEAVITNMTQKFTMFTKDGVPVRAKVDVTFTQHVDPNAHPNQNPTSGGGDIEQVRRFVAGDRLDLIADEVYGDSAKWRLIAERNNITDPLAIRQGQELIIPRD